MNQRAFTGAMLLGLVLLAVAYIWQPWNPGESSLKLGLDLQGGLRVVLEADGVETPTPEQLAAARNVIENRVNEFGVSEPLVQTSGSNRVVVEFPGLTSDQQDRALDLIGQQAVLEFRLVRPGAFDPLTLADLEAIAFTGEIISNASAAYNTQPGAQIGPMVTFEIRGSDQNAFGNFTGSNLGRRMAIVLDGQVVTAPQLNGRISDSGQITGIASIEEASDLALVLRSGSLPFNLNVEEVRSIGPTLGRDSIEAGTIAGIVGSLAIIVAVLLIYGPVFGGALTLGLLIAIMFIFGILAALNAALTLPGLAGLVLTIGAAIDGNVISFERVKELLREGKSLRVSMKQGFSLSRATILDANITSVMTAITLYQYTSGPVRGFAVVLGIGLIVSVFVNIVVVPFLIELFTLRVKKPFMRLGRPAPAYRFLEYARVVVPVTAVVLVASILLLTLRPLNLSTDFTGGISAVYSIPQAMTVAEVRDTVNSLEGSLGSGATIVDMESDDAGVHLIGVRIGAGEGGAVDSTVPTQLAAALGAELVSSDVVGPSVGADLRRGAVLAVVVALVLILVYLAWRFWPNWILGFATTLATAHDVIVTLAVLNLTGAEFSIPVLAALLFVVGYSLNDSIVIADRIRENTNSTRGLSYAQIVDLSVNQSLSRTIITSATTLLPVFALLFFGGPVLRDFSIVLLCGVVIGSLSSVFIMAPILVWFRNRQAAAAARQGTAARTRASA